MPRHNVPTFADLLAAYPAAAAAERMKNERPAPRTVQNVLTGVGRLLKLSATPTSAPVSVMTRRRLDAFLAAAPSLGLGRLAAWSYVFSLRQLVAVWARPYYLELGWRTAAFDIPPCRRRAPRYLRPDQLALSKVRAWYESLALKPDRREWLVATLMLEFAMRNGDVERLAWSDFREKNGAVFLCYTPHKTALSSGRTVAWPVHPGLWREMGLAREALGERAGTHFQGLVVPGARAVFRTLNRDIRSRRLFPASHKALYELRKICIDHIYQHFGAEAASSISGDDIRTVTRFYADPAQVNIPGLRIVELL